MTLLTHTKSIAAKESRAINIMKGIAKVTWEASLPPGSLRSTNDSSGRVYREWAPIFFCVNKTSLDRLLWVQYASLRVALGCISSTPISTLLSEARRALLSLSRPLLANRFVLRNFCWSDKPLTNKLTYLAGLARARNLGCMRRGVV